MLRKQFYQELETLQRDLVQSIIDTADQVFLASASPHSSAVAQPEVAGDIARDRFEWHLARKSLTMLTQQQPVASDFREIVIVWQSCSELASIRQQARVISGLMTHIRHSPLQEIEEGLLEFSQTCHDILLELATTYQSQKKGRLIQLGIQIQLLFNNYDEAEAEIARLVTLSPEHMVLARDSIQIILAFRSIGTSLVQVYKWMHYLHTAQLLPSFP